MPARSPLPALASLVGLTTAFVPAVLAGTGAPPTRPRGMYLESPAIAPSQPGPWIANTLGHRAVFLNRAGGTYQAATSGDDSASNESDVVRIQGMPEATIGAWPHGDAAWASVVSCVRGLFAAYDVSVYDVDPGIPHIEAVLGGSPAQLWIDLAAGGVAVMKNDCSVSEEAIVFVFSETIGPDPRLNCEIAAQEVGHALGMDHALLCADPMTYLSGCGNKSFQNMDADCGEDGPRACKCGNLKQNSHQHLTGVLGAAPADTTPPTVQITVPLDGETVIPGSLVTADATDDQAIVKLDLYVDGVRVAVDGSPPFEFELPPDTPEGPHSLEVRAEDSRLNTASATVAVTVEGQAIGQGLPGSPCAGGADCLTGICHDDGSEQLCTEPCFDNRPAACPEGLVCLGLDEDGEGYCWPADGHFDPSDLSSSCGCRVGGAGPGRGVLAGALLALGIALGLVTRRR